MNLFSSYTLGDLDLKNRLVMAPMTRSRALDGYVPNPLAIAYYSQRASAGLIVTEGTPVSPLGIGYVRTPGIYSAEQVEGWKKITEAVHQAGGKIFAQLWHVGRMSHPDFHNGELPVAPSALAAEGDAFTPTGVRKRMVAPRALRLDEIPAVVEEFRKAAENAKTAGFDGIELHGANGYLLDEFLRDGANQRTDAYGGSAENRARFPLEVVQAVMSVWNPSRVGYKISTAFSMYSMSDSNPAETFTYLTDALSVLKLGYLHLAEPISGPTTVPVEARLAPVLRKRFSGAFMLNGGYDAASGNAAIESGEADLIAYGVPFLANPDLPERYQKNAPLNPPDRATFYTGEEKGYTDYPKLG